MTLDELNTRWKVGPCKVDCEIVNLPGRPPFKRDGYLHDAPLGDFLKAYVEHISIPWYRKKWDWKIVRDIMVRHLNIIHFKFYSI